MFNFVLLFGFLGLGMMLQRISFVPKTSPKYLNWLVIQLCLPALALYYIPKIQWSNELMYPILVPWILFICAWVFFAVLGTYFRWSKKLIGCLILCSGLSNTSFVGFPIISALYGESGMKTAILVDQPGSFVVLSTLGVVVATLYSSGQTSPLQMVKKIAFFPPFLMFSVACLLNTFDYELDAVVQVVLKTIGTLVTPLAMLSVGLQIQFNSRSKHWSYLKIGMVYKLLIGPLLIFILYVVVLKQHSEVIEVALLESAMAPMITGAILASSYRLKPKLCSMMIGFGIPISFITLLFWYWMTKFI